MRAIKAEIDYRSLTRALGLQDGLEVIAAWVDHAIAGTKLWVLVEDKRSFTYGVTPQENPPLPIIEEGKPWPTGIIQIYENWNWNTRRGEVIIGE